MHLALSSGSTALEGRGAMKSQEQFPPQPPPHPLRSTQDNLSPERARDLCPATFRPPNTQRLLNPHSHLAGIRVVSPRFSARGSPHHQHGIQYHSFIPPRNPSSPTHPPIAPHILPSISYPTHHPATLHPPLCMPRLLTYTFIHPFPHPPTHRSTIQPTLSKLLQSPAFLFWVLSALDKNDS